MASAFCQAQRKKKLMILLSMSQGEMFHFQEEINQETAIY